MSLWYEPRVVSVFLLGANSKNDAMICDDRGGVQKKGEKGVEAR